MIFRFITLLLLLWFGFRILFRYIIPIFTISSAANSRLRQMQDQMNDMRQRMNNNNTPENTPRQGNNKQGDYIDYEEIK